MTDHPTPRVGIVMGSDSDWPKIKKAAEALSEFGVPHEVRVMSAHRTPHVVAEGATEVPENEAPVEKLNNIREQLNILAPSLDLEKEEEDLEKEEE